METVKISNTVNILHIWFMATNVVTNNLPARAKLRLTT